MPITTFGLIYFFNISFILFCYITNFKIIITPWIQIITLCMTLVMTVDVYIMKRKLNITLPGYIYFLSISVLLFHYFINDERTLIINILHPISQIIFLFVTIGLIFELIFLK